MTCKYCGDNFKSSKKKICKSCSDKLFYGNIMSALRYIKRVSNKDEDIIKYLAGQNRCLTMGIKVIWTGLYSKEALDAVKSQSCSFNIQKSPPPEIQRKAGVTLDHYNGGTLVFANLVHEFIDGNIKSNKDIEEYITRKFVLTCVTKGQNRSLAKLQNMNTKGYHTYSQYASEVGDLVHFDGSLISKEEKRKDFS